MLFHLNLDFTRHDFLCPYCHQPITVEWTTEYCDPLEGEHSGWCPSCNQTIKFDVEINVTYVAKSAVEADQHFDNTDAT